MNEFNEILVTVENHLTKTGKEQSNSEWWESRKNNEKAMAEILEKIESSLGYSVYNLVNLNFEESFSDLFSLIKRYKKIVEEELDNFVNTSNFLLRNYANSFMRKLFSYIICLCITNKNTKKDKNYVIRKLEFVSGSCQLNNFINWQKKNRILQIFHQLYSNITDYTNNQLRLNNVD